MTVTYKIAKLAKQVGFDLKCNHYYNHDNDFKYPCKNIAFCDWSEHEFAYGVGVISAPTQDNLITWLIEKHLAYIMARPIGNTNKWLWKLFVLNDERISANHTSQHDFDSREEALSDGLLHILKIISNEHNNN